MKMTEQEWRERLTEEEFNVTRLKGLLPVNCYTIKNRVITPVHVAEIEYSPRKPNSIRVVVGLLFLHKVMKKMLASLMTIVLECVGSR